MNTWRTSPAAAPSGLNVIVAIWVIISPWVLGFNNYHDMTWNLVICGAVVLILSGIRLWGPAIMSSLSWINAAIAIWIFISPWVFAESGVGSILWNCVSCGVVIFLLAVWSAVMTQTTAV